MSSSFSASLPFGFPERDTPGVSTSVAVPDPEGAGDVVTEASGDPDSEEAEDDALDGAGDDASSAVSDLDSGLPCFASSSSSRPEDFLFLPDKLRRPDIFVFKDFPSETVLQTVDVDDLLPKLASNSFNFDETTFQTTFLLKFCCQKTTANNKPFC